MVKNNFLKCGVILFLVCSLVSFSSYALNPSDSVKSTEVSGSECDSKIDWNKSEFEINKFLGVIKVPENYKYRCECCKIWDEKCQKTSDVEDRFCMFINKKTQEQAIVSYECAKKIMGNNDLSKLVYVQGEYGIIKDRSYGLQNSTEFLNDMACMNVFKYFFNSRNWVEVTDMTGVHFLINNLRSLCQTATEDTLTVSRVNDGKSFKIDHEDGNIYNPDLAFEIEDHKVADKNKITIKEAYYAFEQFCRKNKIPNCYDDYRYIRFVY